MAKAKNTPTPVDTDSTKFAAESAAAAGPSLAMTALFSGKSALPTHVKRRNMPQLIVPDTIPVGGIVSGTIMDIVDSPVSTVKGKLLHLKHESGVEFTFPCTGVIRNALAPGKSGPELEAALKKEIGKVLYAQRQPDKTSAKYKKTMFMFDVYTSDK